MRADINPEDFIREIENWPAIWDINDEGYSNKIARRKAWEAIIQKFIPDYATMTFAEQSNIFNNCQRKWKNLRDSYCREKARQRKEQKSTYGIIRPYRKRYVFYEHMKFLKTSAKHSDGNQSISDDDSKDGDTEVRTEIQKDHRTSAPKPGRPKERMTRPSVSQDKDEMEIPTRYRRVETEANASDDDKLFLLSLHNDLRTIPDNLKLNVKCQIMNILSSAKQVALSSQNPVMPVVTHTGPSSSLSIPTSTRKIQPAASYAAAKPEVFEIYEDA